MDMQLPLKGSKTPRLGYFLSPATGFWQNAENVSSNFDLHLQSGQLHGKAEVYLDDRLVPHVYAQQENDVYFVQGYLHAKFRLWQMEFQTHAAAGRLSEVLGAGKNDAILNHDKMFRRLGMVYAAENSLKAMEADTLTKNACDAYTAGVNAYVSALKEADYPLEYKILNYKPEPWSNLKTALFLKYMSYELAGFEQDFENTNARSLLSKEVFEKIYPYGQDSLDPVISGEVPIALPANNVQRPAGADSAYLHFAEPTRAIDSIMKPNKNNGSNNWAVHGSKTKSGRPILCNDPHLSLNLPSLWYEMQLSAPGYNAYGVSFPGAPAIIIGFNDSCAFGVTNAERDVRDYYETTFKDSTMQEYRYNGAWQKTTFRDEIIRIKDAASDTEHIAMTVMGPVMYDKHFPDILQSGKAYACRWKAHDASNELRSFILLDKAKGYNDYIDATATFQCPGQNMAFASKSGEIAIRQQGQFPAKWRRQGDFVMPGEDSSYAWQGNIPEQANAVMLNPGRGFISSANQYPYDTTYPYYLGGVYQPYRGLIINRKLASMNNITVEDMQHMQTDNYNVFAAMAKPVLLHYMNESALSAKELRYWNQLKQWNTRNDADETGPTIFTSFWDSLKLFVYRDELHLQKHSLPVTEPEASTLLEGLLKDSAYVFADDITTPEKETVTDMVVKAFKSVAPVLQAAEEKNELVWGRFKKSRITHLLRLPALSRTGLFSGGGTNVINAFTETHGPSWRMVVELTDETNAWGVYPGGQSGNPGSAYYDNFINEWLDGKYYKLQNVKKEAIEKQEALKGVMVFEKA
ncbi:penicillin acylase family protein [Deminuibacter soli]|nr:penicillin acylase family protein [Deminuibacter soli]